MQTSYLILQNLMGSYLQEEKMPSEVGQKHFFA